MMFLAKLELKYKYVHLKCFENFFEIINTQQKPMNAISVKIKRGIQCLAVLFIIRISACAESSCNSCVRKFEENSFHIY